MWFSKLFGKPSSLGSRASESGVGSAPAPKDLQYSINQGASAAEVAALRESVGWDGRQDRYELAIPNSFCYAACRHNGGLVGFGRAISDGVDDAVIFDLAVNPSYQRMGIASRLVDSIIAHCAECGVKAVSVLYEPHLARFYHTRGFLHIGGGIIDTELMNGPWQRYLTSGHEDEDDED